MPQLTLMELEQLHISRVFNDGRTMGTGAAESGITHSDDFDYVITQIREIIYGANTSGTGNWYDLVPTNLTELVTSSGVLATDITEINSFIGRTDGQSAPVYTSTIFVTQGTDLEGAISELDQEFAAASGFQGNILSFIGAALGDTAPTYTSTVFVPQSTPLESAISILDGSIATVSGLLGGTVTWTNAFNNGLGVLDTTNFDADIRLPAGRVWQFNDGAGANPTMEVTLGQIFARNLGRRTFYQNPGPGNIVPGTEVVIPNQITYTPEGSGINLEVHRNGVMLLPGSGITDADENYCDYRESSISGIIINDKIRPNEVLQFKIYG
ncbi:hypothetical protein KAR91_50180 [Candidatus Pacearchaeota archaeon]|nr:hypothetical protein [Candidatus Pacearchaeota archaeon]